MKRRDRPQAVWPAPWAEGRRGRCPPGTAALERAVSAWGRWRSRGDPTLSRPACRRRASRVSIGPPPRTSEVSIWIFSTTSACDFSILSPPRSWPSSMLHELSTGRVGAPPSSASTWAMPTRPAVGLRLARRIFRSPSARMRVLLFSTRLGRRQGLDLRRACCRRGIGPCPEFRLHGDRDLHRSALLAWPLTSRSARSLTGRSWRVGVSTCSSAICRLRRRSPCCTLVPRGCRSPRKLELEPRSSPRLHPGGSSPGGPGTLDQGAGLADVLEVGADHQVERRLRHRRALDDQRHLAVVDVHRQRRARASPGDQAHLGQVLVSGEPSRAVPLG